jgi:hypothetical protein
MMLYSPLCTHVIDGLPPDEINDALEPIFNANRDLNCGSRYSKPCTTGIIKREN